ncbi:ATP-binding cassette domain-containing protein [Collinsella sp. AGMB00827]|uniref:ATP-binding cassette domain-containing protein n=1 Tax=Collinsella ureilytica TaxID=2869515 RepID=A0ABS7MJI1_9ACTN|nr:energy-coupling factor transporter ATPase [Collinsella urealyticum]MBY4797245.1 ATP-binding cassette domain-containing protein [Collinsella urealyticum]
MPDSFAISLDAVRLSYGAVRALNTVSLHIAAGEYVCIVGGNGSGKTSLLELMGGLIYPSQGRVLIFGNNPEHAQSIQEIRQHLAMVFQHPEDQIVTSNVSEDVAFGPENQGVEPAEIARRVDEALAAVGMKDCAQEDPARLSGGQRQRIAIAGALAMQPKILLLDEPTSMLDAEGRASVAQTIETLAHGGITIVHVTHNMEEAMHADRIIALHAGELVFDGAPRTFFSDTNLIEHLGLELPFHLRVASTVRKAGLVTPLTLDDEALIRWVATMSQAVSCSPSAVSQSSLPPVYQGSSQSSLPPVYQGSSQNSSPLAHQSNSRDIPQRFLPLAHQSSSRATSQSSSPLAQQNNSQSISERLDTATRTPLANGHTTPEPALAFQNASFSYGKQKKRRKRKLPWFHPPTNEAPNAVSHLAFAIEPGTCTALVGKTGSGKSTTAELASALVFPHRGFVSVAGIDTQDRQHRRMLRKQIGYVSQLPERQLFAATVFEDIAFGPLNLGLDEQEVTQRVHYALEVLGLPQDPAFLRRSPFSLSGGQQRSVALAGVLAMQQPILVLDEPMIGLDPTGRQSLRSLLLRLKRQGVTLLMVTHDMDDAVKLADRMLVLDRGRLVADGTPREILSAEPLMSPGTSQALALYRRLLQAGAPPAHEREPLSFDELISYIASCISAPEEPQC